MEKEFVKFIKENRLSPFNLYKTPVKTDGENIFKTKDGKLVHNRVLNNISSYFCFADSSNLLNCFPFIDNFQKIIERQEFFKEIPKNLDNKILKELKKPKASWKPKYGIVAVTDDEDTFRELKNLDIPVKFLLNDNDVLDLKNYEVVQAVNVEQFGTTLEQLPQSVFLDSIEDIYLERYLELLSGWIDNFRILDCSEIKNEEISKIVSELKPLLELIGVKSKEKISRDKIEKAINEVNENIFLKLKDLNISGESLFNMLSQNKLPLEIEKIINDSLKKIEMPLELFDSAIPVRINEEELENFFRLQDAGENTDFAEKIKKNAEKLKMIPEKLENLCELLLIYDFISGISQFASNNENWPVFSNEILIKNAKNIFLENPQLISFYLNENERCSILTGANSGGKTTLIEHVIQIVTLLNFGFPFESEIEMPLFSEVYYFAKNKGSANKGAFENLLVQMSKIKPGKSTLILADEIEAVTEPGVAGKIISATAKYFIDKNCFLIIATHLGYEIKKVLPKGARIDGISAVGLDENNELIVNHNPVLGKLANSTPELIVEKMARSNEHDYFVYLHEYLKNGSIIKDNYLN
jgi:hypothetical protein